MTNLLGVLSAGTSALLAQQRAINVTGNNIANVNTPGYARQRLNLQTGTPAESSNRHGRLRGKRHRGGADLRPLPGGAAGRRDLRPRPLAGPAGHARPGGGRVRRERRLRAQPGAERVLERLAGPGHEPLGHDRTHGPGRQRPEPGRRHPGENQPSSSRFRRTSTAPSPGASRTSTGSRPGSRSSTARSPRSRPPAEPPTTFATAASWPSRSFPRSSPSAATRTARGRLVVSTGSGRVTRRERQHLGAHDPGQLRGARGRRVAGRLGRHRHHGRDCGRQDGRLAAGARRQDRRLPDAAERPRAGADHRGQHPAHRRLRSERHARHGLLHRERSGRHAGERRGPFEPRPDCGLGDRGRGAGQCRQRDRDPRATQRPDPGRRDDHLRRRRRHPPSASSATTRPRPRATPRTRPT